MIKNSGSRRRALIIGISDYDKLDPLSFCRNDGQEVSKVLSSLDYDIKDGNVLLGHIEWQKMRETIYDFFNNDNTMPDDLLLFYYSGHGIYNKGLYLAASETDRYLPSRRGFNFEELRRLMNDSISTSVVTILDCCSSGSADISKGQDAASLAKTTIEGTSFQGEGRCILAASQEEGDAFALEENNHNVFASSPKRRNPRGF